jgi:2',3'-cyclic-nucleotide 2'-phosphodiesterase/3'-nucleotidase/5'-nucleotidase
MSQCRLLLLLATTLYCLRLFLLYHSLPILTHHNSLIGEDSVLAKLNAPLSFIAVVSMLLGQLVMPLQAVAAPVAPLPADSNAEVTVVTPPASTQPETLAVVNGPVQPANAPAKEPAALNTASITPTLDIVLSPIGNYNVMTGTAEIVTYDPISQVLYASDATSNTVAILDISDPTNPTPTADSPIDMSAYGAEVTSVDFFSYGSGATEGLLAAVVAADPVTETGAVVVFQRDGTKVFSATVGALPDMVTFTPDGQKLVIANEGEPDGDDDPEGSVSIVNNLTGTVVVSTADFIAFNPISQTLINNGVRIIGPSEGVTATVAQDLEPEYIAVSADSETAYVTLQENNAVAVVEIASSTVITVAALGYKDHSLADNSFDPSDRDDTDDLDDQVFSGTTITDTEEVRGEINLRSWPNVVGMYQPDTIASFQVGLNTYLVTANEGDARGFEEERVKDLTLDATFPNSATIQMDENLGRLEVTKVSGDTDGDGDIDVIHAFGARSFSIWDSNAGLVYDSGNDIEEITAAFDPTRFNGDNDIADIDAFENRSDAKGPEPEGVAVGEIGGQTYAFIGLERFGGIMVYDVTVPASPVFVQFVNTLYKYGSLGPEGMKFISAANSPTSNPLLAVSYEGSNSVVVFEILSSADGAGTLTLLHNNDGESALLSREASVKPGDTYDFGAVTTTTLSVGNVGAFKTKTKEQIDDARSNGNSVINVYAGDAFLASTELSCTQDNPNGPFYDAIAQKQIGYDAHILGNHEFDFGPEFLRRFIDGFKTNGVLQQPFLSSSLDFSASTNLNPLLADDSLYEGYTLDGKVLASSAILVDKVTGQRFGLVSALYWDVATITSLDPVVSKTSDLTTTATVVQTEVDRLTAKGVKKILLVNHLQNNEVDADLIGLIRDVDVVVGGGGDELLLNQSQPITMQILPGEVEPIKGDYPKVVQDADGSNVYLVTGVGQYKYVGRLDVTFNAAGEVVGFNDATSYPRRVIPNDTTNSNITTDLPDLTANDVTDIDTFVEEDVLDPVQECVDALDEPLVGLEVVLDSRRSSVRTKETNAGNSITDAYLWVYDEYAAKNGLTPSSSNNPVVAIQNSGGIRIDNFLPKDQTVPDTMSRADTIDNLPFGNRMSVVTDVTPVDLKAIFERSIAGWPSAAGAHLQAAGLRVYYDTTGTAQVVLANGTVTTVGSRVKAIVLADGTKIVENGQVVSGAPNVTIITNKFTVSEPPAGGDTYIWLFNNPNKLLEMVDNDGLIFDYEQAWTKYLLESGEFPTKTIDLFTGPTIPLTDTRYADQEGEGRLVLTELDSFDIQHVAPFAINVSSSDDVSAQSNGVNIDVTSLVRSTTASGLKFGETQQVNGTTKVANTVTITPEIIPALKSSLIITLTDGVTTSILIIGDNLKSYAPLELVVLTSTLTGTNAGEGAFRIVHAAPFGDSNADADVNVLNSSGSSLSGFPATNVQYGSYTGFFTATVGVYTITVAPAGGNPVLTQTFELAEGDIRTLIVAGGSNSLPLTVVGAEDTDGDIYLPAIFKNSSN